MFDTPRTSTYVAPAEPIDVDSRYLLKVVELVDMGPSKFPQAGDDPDKPTRRIQWKFHMATQDGEKVLDIDGNPYVFVDYTSSKTGKPAPGGSGQTATSRLWMEALFGRALDDDEIGPNIVNDLKGKVATALLEEKDSGRVAIVKLSPYKKGAAPAQEAAQQVRASAAANQATIARSRTAAPVASADDNESPF